MKYFRQILPVCISGVAIFSLLLLVLSTSCSHTDTGNESAAEIETAKIEGREAGRVFINRPWRDTTELQMKLLEARSKRVKYDTTARPRCAEAYDSAFVSTIRTVNPDIASKLEKR